VLRKQAVLEPDEVAPLAESGHAPAQAMLRDDLVAASSADVAEEALARSVLAEISARFATPLYARVDLISDANGKPLLLELEAIEPALYLASSVGAARRFAEAVRAS
jgi:hypothetical protein